MNTNSPAARGRGRNNGRRRGRGGQRTNNNNHDVTSNPLKKILVLHGSRQTGQLLLGRMEKLRKALLRLNYELVAPDGPFEHPDDPQLRQWWDRHGNSYQGLELSLATLSQWWDQQESNNVVGILGFSQGARLAHLIALYHVQHQQNTCSPPISFSGLQFIILVAGYDAPLPDEWEHIIEKSQPASTTPVSIFVPSLHCWGQTDLLVLPEQSKSVLSEYVGPRMTTHEGGHHVPMKAVNVQAFVDFIQQTVKTIQFGSTNGRGGGATVTTTTTLSTHGHEGTTRIEPAQATLLLPDEETAQAQHDEVEALTAIYPDEVTLVSESSVDEETGELHYKHPISFTITLRPEDDNDATSGSHWPLHPLALHVTYPHDYPNENGQLPILRLAHDNNVMEFSSAKADELLRVIRQTAETERGMPSVLACLYAAREFLDSGIPIQCAQVDNGMAESTESADGLCESGDVMSTSSPSTQPLLQKASAERIRQCNMEGLAIAEDLLRRVASFSSSDSTATTSSVGDTAVLPGKGGSWLYTIGLVGKPSAGKSTFFNTASAFARQRDDNDNALGGATMAPHPFTTIDPNIGFCLVPAPIGSCPEDDYEGDSIDSQLAIGSSHGRDSKGRRLVPVLLKDVAGLVPGAYQGRGRGNKFLNDLIDADVLVHVVDASGSADAEGNVTWGGEDEEDNVVSTSGGTSPSQPLEDLAWTHNELIEWVFANVTFKWDVIQRKGRTKLSGMFSGYGQTLATVWDVLLAVEKFMERNERRDRALDKLDEWDTGDVHRLVSAFLGVRFPMALALNKYDMPGSAKHVQTIQEALPLHGARVGVPLSARNEMLFVRYHLLRSSLGTEPPEEKEQQQRQIPLGTWQCLQSALMLRTPVLIFPVVDMVTYEPLPGLIKYATGDPSLPSPGMIACLEAAGGSAPSLWNPFQGIYSMGNTGMATKSSKKQPALRDVLLMKPGSTVDDVFVSLKNRGALGGEFIRAEGAGRIGEKAKLIAKTTIVSRSCCILKIMTTKKSPWQATYNK